MRAAWYEARGPAREVLVVGEMPDPAPGPGEVRIRIEVSGLNPGDVKKRAGWQGAPMPYPRVIPHSDGAGVIDAVGAGATTIAVVRDHAQVPVAKALGAHHCFVSDAGPSGDGDLAAQIRAVTHDGGHRISEVDFAGHVDLNAAVIATGGVICAYSTSDERPSLPYWPLAFSDVALRLLGSDDFPPAVKAKAAADLTVALSDGAVRSTVVHRLPLDDIAAAHDLVEQGAGGRVVLQIQNETP